MKTRVTDLIDDPNDLAKAEARVRAAYEAFVEGRASKDDADVIMIDLAMASGYYEVLPITAQPNELAAHNGARTVYARIMYVLNLPPEVVAEYQSALLGTPNYQNPE